MSYPRPPEFTENRSVKKKKPRTVAIVNDNCTGCEVCVPFCPVECIDHEAPPGYPFSPTDPVIPPIRIRVHECIGCAKCAKACELLTWNAIDMIPADQFEQEFGAKLTDSPFPEPGRPAAFCASDRKPAEQTA